MTTFIKQSTVPVQARLLYIMGSTWHNQCMFDLKTDESNFSDLLNNAGFETYTFDIKGTGSYDQTELIGNCHQFNLKQCLDIIKEHSIDYVIGYSYGALVASDLLAMDSNIVKKIILLDPYPGIAQEAVYTDNGDKKIVTIQSIVEDLEKFGSNMTTATKSSYLEQFANGNSQLITAAYPGKVLKENFNSFISDSNIARLNQENVKVFFTKNSKPLVRNKFSNHVLYNQASHWILNEPSRFDFAKDVLEFFGP